MTIVHMIATTYVSSAIRARIVFLSTSAPCVSGAGPSAKSRHDPPHAPHVRRQ